MKITNLDLITIYNILETYGQKKFPQRISYAIVRNTTLLAHDVEAYNKALQKILDEYEPYTIKKEDSTTEMQDNGLPKVDKEHEESYTNDIIELLNIEIEVNLHTIDEKEFDYEDSEKYDAMSASEILTLQRVLCKR